MYAYVNLQLISIRFDWISTKLKVARLKQEMMLIYLLISRKSRSKSSRSDMRTLESIGSQALRSFFSRTLFKASTLKSIHGPKIGCWISSHYICVTYSKNEGRWEARVLEGKSANTAQPR